MADLNFGGLKTAVRRERDIAARQARAYTFTRSRGTYLHTTDREGQCFPRPQADCPMWRGTRREVTELVAKVLADYPKVTSIYIGGGYDGADTFAGLWEFYDYEPWVSSWDVLVWTRDGGYELFQGEVQ